MEYIVTFFTHFGAIRFGRQLKGEGITHRMMPVPRKLSSSCGTCVRVEGRLPEGIGADEEIEGAYRIQNEDYEVLFERV